MKNLDYYLKITDKTHDKTFLSLIEPNISGGTISKNTIDKIKNHPDKKIITISGLKQDTFDYFIKNYGNQFDIESKVLQPIRKIDKPLEIVKL